MMGVKQDKGFSDPEAKEARVCLFALRTAVDNGYRSLVVEGDCQAFIGRLKAKDIPNNSLGYFILEILALVVSLDFIVSNFIKRGGNKVAHAMAHLQPIDYHERI